MVVLTVQCVWSSGVWKMLGVLLDYPHLIMGVDGLILASGHTKCWGIGGYAGFVMANTAESG